MKTKKLVEPKSVRATRAKAAKALDVLAAYGRLMFCPTTKVSYGVMLGMAIARLSNHLVVFDAAVAGLEDWNSHLCVALLLAVEKKQGTVKRKGRDVTIKLPKHWEDLKTNL